MTCVFRRESCDADTLVFVSGDIDLANAAQFHRELEEAARGGGTIVVDLSDCQYMDSTGLHVLAKMHGTARNRMRLVVPEDSSVRRILDITGFGEIVHIAGTIEAARAS